MVLLGRFVSAVRRRRQLEVVKDTSKPALSSLSSLGVRSDSDPRQGFRARKKELQNCHSLAELL